MVVKMVLYAFDDLVVLMPLAGYEDHIPRLRKRAGGLYRCLAVLDYQGTAQFLFRQSGFHVIQDIRRLLVARVVGGQNQLLAASLGYLRHHRTLAFIPVAAATYHSNEFPLSFVLWPFVTSNDLPDRTDYIIYCIRRMGVIDNRCPALRAADGLKTAVDRLQRTQHAENLRLLKTQTQRCAVDTEQIAYIESPYKRHKHLFAVDIQHHTLESLFEYLRLIVRQRAGGVGVYGRLAVLRHHQPVLVIDIRNGKSRLL